MILGALVHLLWTHSGAFPPSILHVETCSCRSAW